jgi:hypothetical protein
MELLSEWVPAQTWFTALDDLCTLDAVGAYRFDDPDGEVGIESHLLRTIDGQVFHVPVTYRGAPLGGAEASLVGTMQHSALGPRWVYDACGDPAYAQALATVILTGGSQADVEVVTDQGRVRQEPTVKVTGSGLPGSAVPHLGPVTYWTDGARTLIKTGDFDLTVLRVVDGPGTASPPGVGVLVGTWPGHGTPALLATARGK